MAAYSALACFRQTLKQLLDSDQFPVHFPKPRVESLHENVRSLQSSLDKIRFVPKVKRDAMDELQCRIREAIYAAQDKVEYSIISDAISGENWWREIADAISDVEEKAKILAEEINNDPKAQNLFSLDRDLPTKLRSSLRDTIVERDEDFPVICDWLRSEPKQRLVMPITGLPGLGKTTLARKIYESKEAKNNFNIRAWVTVSQDFNLQEIYSDLLSSMESKNYDAWHYATQGDEQTLFNRLHQGLYNLKYLIVVDDVWDAKAWEKISPALPDKENGSRILLTTRIRNVAKSIQEDGYIHEIKPLGSKGSWELLCYKVFDEIKGETDITNACPHALKEIGMSIAEKCNGLPLSLTVVGGLLLQERVVVKYWKSVEEDVSEAVASKGDKAYLDILSLSYTYLPARLKALFLYMGAFPEDSQIRVSKLIKLWVAEGFLPSPLPQYYPTLET